METLSLLGHLISTFSHLLLGRQAQLPPSFLLEKLIHDDLKSKTKMSPSHLYIKIAKQSPQKFLRKVEAGQVSSLSSSSACILAISPAHDVATPVA